MKMKWAIPLRLFTLFTSQSAQVRGTRFQTSFDYDYDSNNDNDNNNNHNHNNNNNMRIELWVSAFTRIAMLIDAITNRVQGKGQIVQ